MAEAAADDRAHKSMPIEARPCGKMERGRIISAKNSRFHFSTNRATRGITLLRRVASLNQAACDI